MAIRYHRLYLYIFIYMHFHKYDIKFPFFACQVSLNKRASVNYNVVLHF